MHFTLSVATSSLDPRTQTMFEIMFSTSVTTSGLKGYFLSLSNLDAHLSHIVSPEANGGAVHQTAHATAHLLGLRLSV